MNFHWTSGNQLELLENGDEYFPRVFQAIKSARREVIIETFILFEDVVGLELRDCLREAAKRGVNVMVTVDGYGSPDLSEEFVTSLTAVGVHFRTFDPCHRLLGLRTSVFRRLHRKVVVIDGVKAFVGGINLSEEHLCSYGHCAKQDYAVEIAGPVVADIQKFAHTAFDQYEQRSPWPRLRWRRSFQSRAADGQGSRALFVVRDNHENRNTIEEHYLKAMRNARHRLMIANAYFFPGYRVFHEICVAARRGVDVHLVLQGMSDQPLAKTSAKMLYDHLLKSGVNLYECVEGTLHGKIALADDEWSTIGSSNLDPLSLSFNLEANVVVLDKDFNERMHVKMRELIEQRCRRLDPKKVPPRTMWRVFVSFCVFHFLRHFPSWAMLIPSRPQRVDDAHDRQTSDSGLVG